MKPILFTSLNDHVPWGGSEELWSQTALFLAQTHNVEVLIKKWENEPNQIEILKDNGIKVRYKANTKSLHQALFTKIANKLMGQKVDDYVDFTEYKHVFISLGDHLDFKLIGLAQDLKANNVPYSIIVQLATDLRNIGDNTSIKLFDAYKNAKSTFFLSEENIAKTEMLFGEELLNKVRINNPFNFRQEYFSIDKENYNLACVAAYTSFHKSQDLLITVLGLDKWKKRNIRLNLYGSGINKNQLERLISKYELQHKVRLHGFVPDKSSIWRTNMCCIMPSRMEGQSLAMLEAMSYGRMVISTLVGDAKRLVIDGHTGFLIASPTLDHIDEALERAWNNKDNWVAYGKNARTHLFNTITTDPVKYFANKIKDLL